MTLCRLSRTLASLWLDDLDQLPAFIQAHVRDCPACRERLGHDSHLVTSLRAAAPAGREPLPPFLAARIRSRVRPCEDEDRSARVRTGLMHRLAWAGATIASVWLVGVLLVRWFEPDAQPSAGSPRPVELGATLALPTGETWARWGQRLEQPLNREIDSALEDSRGALLVLVQNFVPERHVAAVTEKANGLFPERSFAVTGQP